MRLSNALYFSICSLIVQHISCTTTTDSADEPTNPVKRLFASIVSLFSGGEKAAEWGYLPSVNAPETWSAGRCRNGSRQSPVDIRLSALEYFPRPSKIAFFDALTLHNYERRGALRVHNTGHTGKTHHGR